MKYAILSGEVIEEYPKDKYGPSCLIYGIGEERRIEGGDQRSEDGGRRAGDGKGLMSEDGGQWSPRNKEI